MAYRDLPPERIDELLWERITTTAAHISRIDQEIGEWSVLLGDGADAPPAVLALWDERKALVSTLHHLSAVHRR